MLSLFSQSPILFFLVIIGLLLAITIHEFSHALAADLLGDPNPRSNGRLTLNPLAHLDPLGSLALLFFGFGWGKPVETIVSNLQHPRRDIAIISFAGPLSNLILAIILSFFLSFTSSPLFISLFTTIIYINLMLAIFNLLPIYPLDGEKILVGLLPRETAFELQAFMRQYGTIILLFLILPLFNGASFLTALISPVISFFFNLLV